MRPTNNGSDEERFLDALIRAALSQRNKSAGTLPDLATPPPPLTKEDQEALDALGADFIAQILAGTWKPRRRRWRQRPAREAEQELAGAMQRGPEEGELSEQAWEEIERKIHDLDAEEDAKEEP